MGAMYHGCGSDFSRGWIVALQAKGAAPRKQHYVPQFYLRKFTGAKDMLLVFDREKKETYRSKPLGVAAQRDFNRIDVEGMDANAVEKVLSEFEGETAPHLDRIIANKSIADQGDRGPRGEAEGLGKVGGIEVWIRDYDRFFIVRG